MIDRLKLSDGRKKESKSGLKVLEIIKEAARKATKEVLKRRKAAEQETANILKVARNNAARIAAEEKAAEAAAVEEAARVIAEEKAAKTAVKEDPDRAAAEEKAARKAAEEETARVDAGDKAARKAAEEETARVAAEDKVAGTAAKKEAERIADEEKAARKAAKKQKATEDAALWVAESIRALGDSVELNDQDAVAAARNICDALDWKFLKNLTGCQIEYSMDEDFSDCKKEKIKKSDDLSTLLKKMEAGKQYYVRARLCASIKDKKHCSVWSEVIRMKT